MKPQFAIIGVLLLAALLAAGTCLSREAKPQSFAITWNYDTSG